MLPAAKKGRAADGAGVDAEMEASKRQLSFDSSANPFGNNESSFLKCLMERSICTVGEVFDERFSDLEDKIEATEASLSETHALAESVASKATQCAKDVAKLQETVAQQAETIKCLLESVPRESDSVSPAVPPGIFRAPTPMRLRGAGSGNSPQSQQFLVRLGGLAWDGDRETLLSNGKKVLQDAGVDTSIFGTWVPLRTPGSMLQAMCTSSEGFLTAQHQVRCAAVTIAPNKDGDMKPVFLVKKRDEALQADLTAFTRCHEIIKDLWCSITASPLPEDPQHIRNIVDFGKGCEKIGIKKALSQITFDDQKLCYVSGTMLAWDPLAEKLLDGGERAMCENFVYAFRK